MSTFVDQIHIQRTRPRRTVFFKICLPVFCDLFTYFLIQRCIFGFANVATKKTTKPTMHMTSEHIFHPSLVIQLSYNSYARLTRAKGGSVRLPTAHRFAKPRFSAIRSFYSRSCAEHTILSKMDALAEQPLPGL